MITAAALRDRSLKDLLRLAKKQGIVGGHAMRKEQLIRALVRSASSNGAKAKKSESRTAAKQTARPRRLVAAQRRTLVVAAPKKNGVAKNGAAKHAVKASAKRPSSIRKQEALRKIRLAHEAREQRKDLSTTVPAGTNGRTNGKSLSPPARRDRVVLMVRDPYWLHVCWEIGRRSVERVKAAMSEMWHTAKPMLRLLEVDGGSTTSTAERIVREIEIHGGVNNWYLDISEPAKSFRVDVGYLSASGRFFSLARSNAVTTPRPGSGEAFDQNWTDVAKNFERVYALSGGYSDEPSSGDLKELFEERLRRPMSSPFASKYGAGADGVGDRRSDFALQVDAELIVFGQTRPDAHVTLAGQPVKVHPDGSFAVRKSMPDRRQVLPLVAGSRDGLEQRTIILAIERNTKVMEPVTRDGIV